MTEPTATPSMEAMMKALGMTEQQIRAAMAEAGLENKLDEEFELVVAQAALLVKQIIRGSLPAARMRVGQSWVDFLQEAAINGELDPTEFARATSPEAFLAAVSGNGPAALGTADANLAESMRQVMAVLTEQARKLGYGEDVRAYLTTGLLLNVDQIASRGLDAARSFVVLVAAIAQAASPSNPLFLTDDGTVQAVEDLRLRDGQLATANAEITRARARIAELELEVRKYKPVEDVFARRGTDQATQTTLITRFASIASGTDTGTPDAAELTRLRAIETRFGTINGHLPSTVRTRDAMLALFDEIAQMTGADVATRLARITAFIAGTDGLDSRERGQLRAYVDQYGAIAAALSRPGVDIAALQAQMLRIANGTVNLTDLEATSSFFAQVAAALRHRMRHIELIEDHAGLTDDAVRALNRANPDLDIQIG